MHVFVAAMMLPLDKRRDGTREARHQDSWGPASAARKGYLAAQAAAR